MYSDIWPQIGLAWSQYTLYQHKTQVNRIKDEIGFTGGLNNLWSAK